MRIDAQLLSLAAVVVVLAYCSRGLMNRSNRVLDRSRNGNAGAAGREVHAIGVFAHADFCLAGTTERLITFDRSGVGIRIKSDIQITAVDGSDPELEVVVDEAVPGLPPVSALSSLVNRYILTSSSASTVKSGNSLHPSVPMKWQSMPIT